MDGQTDGLKILYNRRSIIRLTKKIKLNFNRIRIKLVPKIILLYANYYILLS